MVQFRLRQRCEESGSGQEGLRVCGKPGVVGIDATAGADADERARSDGQIIAEILRAQGARLLFNGC